MSETLPQSVQGPGRSVRLLSMVGLWLLVLSSLTATPLQGCQWHPTDSGSGFLESGSVGTPTSTRAEVAPSESDPAPGEHHHGADECCCPASCGGLSGLEGSGVRSAAVDADPRLGPVLLPHATGPAAWDEPFLLPFAIPPPLFA